MRKLQSKELVEKKRKRNQMWLGVALVIVMFGSVFGVIVNSFNASNESGEVLTYKGYEVIQQGSYYLLKIGDKVFYLSQNPNDLSFVYVNVSKIITSYVAKPLYIDSVSYPVTQELYQNLQGYPQRIQMACYDEADCVNDDLPIKDCTNNIIIIRESEENKVYEEELCVFIEGKKEDLLGLTDVFLLKTLGIN